MLPAPLQPLAAWERFVVWFATPDTDRPGKMKKLAVNWQTGAVCAPEDPTAWTTYENALNAAPRHNRGHGSGAGFVFCEDDPFFFLDIDNCLQPDNTWAPIALEMCQRFAGAAIEVSQSGRGLHIFGRAAPIEHGTRCQPLGLELYTSRRFVALTGTNATGDAGTDHTAALHDLCVKHFPPPVATASSEWTDTPCAEWIGPDDDDELLRRMLAAASRSAAARFGGEQRFSLPDLWAGNVSDNERSEADQSLAGHLAFWTGRNCERIERMMRKSGLAREKWDSPHHANYLRLTIIKATGFVNSVYQEKRTGTVQVGPVTSDETPPEATAAPSEPGIIPRSAQNEYVGPSAQLLHFKGCHYVGDLKAIYCTEDGRIYSQQSFNVRFGGHMFVLDSTNSRKTDSAWEAFTQSAVNTPSYVDALCFRPEIPPGQIITEGTVKTINSYIPYEAPSRPGDAGLFIDLMTKLFPDDLDRTKLLSYMASCVQNPGVKFQWWPVVQGAEGNGKTALLTVMTYCIGEQYTFLPNSHAMARDGLKFNSWIERKLFVGIEEIKLSGRREFLDEFKIIVTNRRIPSEGKGTNAVNTDNRANGLLLTNHIDGVPIERGTRRYASFWSAQQSPADIERDGLTPEYFHRFWKWLDTDGLPVICHFLRTMPLIAEFDPAQLATRAPETSSRAQAIAVSQGRVEQEILEAIDEGRPGFAGGWVSSRMLDDLIDSTRIYIPRAKRRLMMQTLGYDLHPALPDGRTNQVVMPDNSKPRLYIKDDHEALRLTEILDVERAYTAAQMPHIIASPPAAVLAFAHPQVKKNPAS